MGAAADCEAIREGLLGQPVNALTTIAFVVLGLLLLSKSKLRWVGIAMIATGVGSFLFHGPMPPGNEWAHDTSLAWLLAVVAGWGTRWETLTRLPALAGLGLVFAVLPAAADPIAVVLTVVGVVSLIRRRAVVYPLLLAAVAGIYGRLGATGGPLCDPDSWWQPHGVWHLAAATAVFWLAQADEKVSGPDSSPGDRSIRERHRRHRE